MNKQLCLTREFALNKSKTKSLWIAYEINNDIASPVCNIFGDKSQIYLDQDSWHGLRHSKKDIFSYMLGSSREYYRSFESAEYVTVFSGKAGANDSPLLYMQQTNKNNGKMDYLYLGFVTIDRLFSLENLINHYMLFLERNALEVNEFLMEMTRQKQMGDMSYMDNMKKQTSLGLDLGMLLQELETAPLH